VANILTALDEIEEWNKRRMTKGAGFPTDSAQSIRKAVAALCDAFGKAERSKLPRKLQPASGQFVPVKLPEIVAELRAACDRVKPMGEVLPGVHDLFYWPGIRESLKRLHELLPADIDLAECDASIREQLRDLQALVIEIWDRMWLGDGTRSRPFFLYSGYREHLNAILEKLPALEAPDQENAGDGLLDRPSDTSAARQPAKKSKRSTERGEGRAKLIAALTNHHQYAGGGCLILEPVGNNELARTAGVAKRTASAFFNKDFRGHAKYRTLCNDPPRLVAALKALNGEFRPHEFYDARTPDELEVDDE
jgi:hypothetical protein